MMVNSLMLTAGRTRRRDDPVYKDLRNFVANLSRSDRFRDLKFTGVPVGKNKFQDAIFIKFQHIFGVKTLQ
jgi:hypothetical protein